MFLNLSITDILWGFVGGECPCALYDIEHHPPPEPTRSEQHHPTWDDQRCLHTFFPGVGPSHSWLRTVPLSPALLIGSILEHDNEISMSIIYSRIFGL